MCILLTDESGRKYKMWEGTRVYGECELCGVIPTSVDDCGQFGNRMCPKFGTGE